MPQYPRYGYGRIRVFLERRGHRIIRSAQDRDGTEGTEKRLLAHQYVGAQKKASSLGLRVVLTVVVGTW